MLPSDFLMTATLGNKQTRGFKKQQPRDFPPKALS